MSVSTTANRKQVTLTAASQGISTGIYILDEDHLIVQRTRAGVDTISTKDTDYTVSGVLNQAGATVTVISQAIGDVFTITRFIEKTQTTDYIANSKFSSTNTETNLDKLTLIVQDQDEILARAIKLPKTATDSQIAAGEITLGGVGTFLGISSQNVTEFLPIPTFGGTEKVYASKGIMSAASDITVGTRAIVLGEAEPFELKSGTNPEAGNAIQGVGLDSGVPGAYWQRQFSGVANVIWWNLVADGVANDTLALQAALDAGQKEILIKTGVVLCDQVTIPANTKLILGDTAELKMRSLRTSIDIKAKFIGSSFQRALR